MTRAELKARAKLSLQGNWGIAIAVMLILVAVAIVSYILGIPSTEVRNGTTVPTRREWLGFFVSEAFSVGTCSIFLSLLREGKAEIKQIFDGFRKCYVSALIANLLRSLLIGLALGLSVLPIMIVTLLGYNLPYQAKIFVVIFITLAMIAGIIFAVRFFFMFSQIPYILADHPELKGTEALKASREMMKGHWGDYFVLGLSFFPWLLLCILIIPMFYVMPYYEATLAAFYDDLKTRQEAS